jgi:DsbC/DsbD-like thiol-disulfide interchange protein
MPMTISLLCAALVALAPSMQEPRTTPADGNGLVRLALIADREAVRPGERFTLGVHLKMEPGWHVYWHNPGDSGIATSAKITAPAGFQVGPLRFPAPERHELEGEIVSYIHEGDLLLVADAVAPADAAPGSKAHFAVESRWLVCTEVCFGGSGEASFDLPLSPATAPEAARANQKLFDAARARAPRPWSEIASRASITTAGEARAPVHKVRVRGASELEFFPDESKTTTLASRTAKTGAAGGTIELVWTFEPLKDADRAETRGVLEVRTGNEVAFYEFDPAAATAPPAGKQ